MSYLHVKTPSGKLRSIKIDLNSDCSFNWPSGWWSLSNTLIVQTNSIDMPANTQDKQVVWPINGYNFCMLANAQSSAAYATITALNGSPNVHLSAKLSSSTVIRCFAVCAGWENDI